MPASRLRAGAVLAAGLAGFAVGTEFRGPHPPGTPSFVRAIGAVDDLPESLRLAFAPGPGFAPVSRPAERGQSFAGYVRSGPNRATPERRRVLLVPLGGREIGPEELLPLAEYAERFFGVASAVEPAMGLVPLARFFRRDGSTGEPYLDTTALLDLLAARVPADACSVIAVTRLALGSKSKAALAGEASLRTRAGVASLSAAGFRRDAMVLTHEIAHTLGIPHCVHYRCLMNEGGASGKPMHLCPVCLRKLNHATGVDPVERYRRLLDAYRTAGLDDEAEWTDERVREIDRGVSPGR